jgi:hypothetical protein
LAILGDAKNPCISVRTNQQTAPVKMPDELLVTSATKGSFDSASFFASEETGCAQDDNPKFDANQI